MAEAVPWLLRPFIWDHVHLRPVHLRLFSFESTFVSDHVIWENFIWDHIRFRPQWFETTFIWDHFIWDYIDLRSHSFYAMLKWSCFDLLCITFYDLPFTFLRETWSFASWLFIWSFVRLHPSVSRGDSRWFVNAPALRAGSRGQRGNWPGPLTPRGHPVWIIICFK